MIFNASFPSLFMFTASDYNQYLISKELDLPNTPHSLVFQYRAESDEESFRVLASTTTNDIDAFTNVLGEVLETEEDEWTGVQFLIPAGTKYVAINYFGEYVYRLYIDNIVFNDNDLAKNIDAYISRTRESNNDNAYKTLHESWRTYTELLKVQQDNRSYKFDTVSATGVVQQNLTRLVSEKVAEDFFKLYTNPEANSGLYDNFKEGGRYTYYA